MGSLGKSPIPAPVLILGKLTMLGSWLFMFFKSFFNDGFVYDSPTTRVIGIVMFVGGILFVIIGIVTLGRSVSVGLPEEKTTLKMTGVYRVSRNPIYVGGFLMCAGSCVFALHPANLILFAITIFIHHLIVMKEEEFLEKTFEESWKAYRMRTPRYLGIVR